MDCHRFTHRPVRLPETEASQHGYVVMYLYSLVFPLENAGYSSFPRSLLILAPRS